LPLNTGASTKPATREHGVACLSVHDSFIVPAAEGDRLKESMDEEFANACWRLRLRS
jgi:hypothetical protein